VKFIIQRSLSKKFNRKKTSNENCFFF